MRSKNNKDKECQEITEALIAILQNSQCFKNPKRGVVSSKRRKNLLSKNGRVYLAWILKVAWLSNQAFNAIVTFRVVIIAS